MNPLFVHSTPPPTTHIILPNAVNFFESELLRNLKALSTFERATQSFELNSCSQHTEIIINAISEVLINGSLNEKNSLVQYLIDSKNNRELPISIQYRYSMILQCVNKSNMISHVKHWSELTIKLELEDDLFKEVSNAEKLLEVFLAEPATSLALEPFDSNQYFEFTLASILAIQNVLLNETGSAFRGRVFVHLISSSQDLNLSIGIRNYLQRSVKMLNDQNAFVGLTLERQNLNFFNLAGLNLRDSMIINSQLSCADLTDANLSGVLMIGTDSTGANWDGAILDCAMIGYNPRRELTWVI